MSQVLDGNGGSHRKFRWPFKRPSWLRFSRGRLIIGLVIVAVAAAVFSWGMGWLKIPKISLRGQSVEATQQSVAKLSSGWAPEIQRWKPEIEAAAKAKGNHPGLGAAIIAICNPTADPHFTSANKRTGLTCVTPSDDTGDDYVNRPVRRMLEDPTNALLWTNNYLSYLLAKHNYEVQTVLEVYLGEPDGSAAYQLFCQNEPFECP